MSIKASLYGLLGLLIVVAWATPGVAVQRTVSGSAQFFIGQGLPIPHPAFGGGRPVTSMGNGSGTTPGGGGPPGGVVTANVSTTGPASAPSITLPPGQFRHDGTPRNQPVLFANPYAFQVYTNLIQYFPGATFGGSPQTVVFRKGGRTGNTFSPTITWCPGYTAFLPNNPGCTNPNLTRTIYIPIIPACATKGAQTVYGGYPCSGPLTPTKMPGHLRYTATKNQFGGPGRGKVFGTFNVALRPGGGTLAAFVGGAPNPSGVIGAALGVYNQNVPPKGYVYKVLGYTGLGAITSIATTPMALGPSNITTGSFGGPWTTGTLTIFQPAATPAEKFTLVGNDQRTTTGTMAGQGNILLVSGSVSRRQTTRPNANRGLLLLTVPEPAAALSAAAALLSLVVGHRLARRRSR